MEMPFGKFKDWEVADFKYEHLPYLNWLLANVQIRSRKLNQALEWRVLDLESELDILATYYTMEIE